MTKKLFGGASLLIFVMTLLVITNSAYSHDNREDWYQITINYVCLSGEIIYSETEWDVDKWNQDHPPDVWRWEKVCWDVYNWDEDRWEEECEWMEVPYHQSHWITYRLYEDYKTIKRRATPNRCRSLR